MRKNIAALVMAGLIGVMASGCVGQTKGSAGESTEVSTAASIAASIAASTAASEGESTAASAAVETSGEASKADAEESEMETAGEEAVTVNDGEEAGNAGSGENGGPGGNRPGGPGGNGGNRGNRGGGTDKSADAKLQAMIADVAPQFQLMTYEDAETGTSLQYQLYIPGNYDESRSYPLIQFIPDSSVVGRDADYVLTQGWGGLIWATEEEQAKHPAFVFVPIFTETVVDDSFNHSEQIDVAVRALKALTGEYSIDTSRLYTTGQSMGGMTSFYLNIAYPDLFAASLFVGSQWDTHLLDILEDEDFFYIVAAGDPRASAGQAELMSVFDADGAAYSHAEWSAQDDAGTQNSAVAAMLEEGNRGNFITFTLGSTTADGSTGNSMAGEHMTSFDYAYKIEAVRDWLFAQSGEAAL